MTRHQVCTFPGCGRPTTCMALCCQHNRQRRRGLTLQPIKVPGPRALIPHPDLPGVLLVPLTRGQFALIDAADAEAVGKRSWIAEPMRGTFYALSGVRVNGKRATERLHVFLWTRWGFPVLHVVDHRNGDGLDCRRENLRAATHSQNQANRVRIHKVSSAGATGVERTRGGRFSARITLNKVKRRVGVFDTLEEASRAYQAAMAMSFGEFARVAQ